MIQAHALTYEPHTSQYKPFVEWEQSLVSRVNAVSRFVAQVMNFILLFRDTDGSELDIEVAVREAILNAVIHANEETPDKRVYVTCSCSRDGEVSLTIRDEGNGFDPGAVPDPTTRENRLATHGRGIYPMRALMDEVSFEQGGTVVRMRKKANADRGDRIQ